MFFYFNFLYGDMVSVFETRPPRYYNTKSSVHAVLVDHCLSHCTVTVIPWTMAMVTEDDVYFYI